MAERFILYNSEPVSQLIIPGDTAIRQLNFAKQMQAYEKFIIEYALNHCERNIASTADYLGLPRRTLNDKLQKHGIERSS